MRVQSAKITRLLMNRRTGHQNIAYSCATAEIELHCNFDWAAF